MRSGNSKKGKSPDSDGIRAEDIKACDEETEAWKKVKIEVLHKKGDVETVGNYCPTCSLPALYKLSRRFCTEDCIHDSTKNKLKIRAGFRSSYQTTDHIATYRMIEQKCHEWGIKMWIATIDFTKTFDSITHKSIWKAINSCGINHEYIVLLKKNYKDQKASVQTNVKSNMFEIKKGTEQGDPLSSLLFNTVLQNSLKEVTQRWQKKKGMGINLSDNDHDCLTNLRFADDVLLFASFQEQLQNMLCKFKKSTEKVGLRIHPKEKNS